METNIYEIKLRIPSLQSFETCFWFLQFYFQKTGAFIEEDKSSEKNVIVEQVLDGIDIDDIGNLEDSSRPVFINEECENLNDGGKLTRNINQKKKSEVLQQSIDVLYLTNAEGGRISPITMWNIVNQLVKYDISNVSVVKNLKDRNFFLIK